MVCSLLRSPSRSIVRFAGTSLIRAAIPAQFELVGACQAEFVICNQSIEQDHRGFKRRVNPGLGFGSFATVERMLQGYEIAAMGGDGAGGRGVRVIVVEWEHKSNRQGGLLWQQNR